MDDFCDSLGLMAVGHGDVLHSRGIHPSALDHCGRRGTDSHHSRAQATVARARWGGGDTPVDITRTHMRISVACA